MLTKRKLELMFKCIDKCFDEKNYSDTLLESLCFVVMSEEQIQKVIDLLDDGDEIIEGAKAIHDFMERDKEDDN